MSRYKRPLRLCTRNNILRSTDAKYHYSYLFFYKINKGELPLMLSCYLVSIHRLFIELGFLAVIV